ncbi:ubiquitin system component CUE protein [Senna tora]|uniref:Ubiquitin system component CUE protein n=1 Tax=Senna tora TaxID=362788 RepID=A0A834WEP5_9FABA|nr:ubiquitin system component CUE protein [Senna tora]
MSAAVCGSKRSFFEDIPPSPPVSKRLRCSSSTSPIRFSAPTLVDHLRSLFPHMEVQVYLYIEVKLLLERALQECGNDLDAAIKSLNELCLRSADGIPGSAEGSDANVETAGTLKDNGDASAYENQSSTNNLPANGAEWVDLFVREMMSATSVDDARTRASRMLEVLEKSISGHARAEATHVIQKENIMLKEQIEGLTRENTILKSAFKIQHERQTEYESKSQELQHLKQLVSQYQEQLRTLEVNNYALAMHLKQAQQCNSFPGRFHPDIF